MPSPVTANSENVRLIYLWTSVTILYAFYIWGHIPISSTCYALSDQHTPAIYHYYVLLAGKVVQKECDFSSVILSILFNRYISPSHNFKTPKLALRFRLSLPMLLCLRKALSLLSRCQHHFDIFIFTD